MRWSASRRSRERHPVYELTPEALGDPVDYAVVGDVLIHLRDPVRGLATVRTTLTPCGRILLLEEVNVPLSLRRPRTAWASFQARRRVYRRDTHGAQARWHVALEAVR
jgi:hypothetical protein